jgi:hypothetical protein
VDILLIAGLWLDASVWDNVAAHDQRAGRSRAPAVAGG